MSQNHYEAHYHVNNRYNNHHMAKRCILAFWATVIYESPDAECDERYQEELVEDSIECLPIWVTSLDKEEEWNGKDES